MRHARFLFYIKLLIFLSPLPFGCVGSIFSSLFYIALLLLSFWGLNFVRPLAEPGPQMQSGDPLKRSGPAIDGKSFYLPPGRKGKNSILYEKSICYLGLILGLFFLLQVIPLPMFILKIISPHTVKTLAMLHSPLPGLHPLSMVPLDTVIYGIKAMVMVFFVLVLVRIPFSKQQVISLLNVIVFTAAVQVIFGIIKYVLGNKYFFLFFYPDNNAALRERLTGTLGNSNHFAFFLEMVIPLALALLFLKVKVFSSSLSLRERIIRALNTDKQTLYYVSVVVIMGVAIYLTGSRAGIVTMMISFFLFAQLSFYLTQLARMRDKLKYIYLLTMVVAIMLGLQNTIQRFMDSGFAGAGRFLRWPNTMSMISDFPLFGTGFGTYRYAFFLYDTSQGKWSTHAHSDLLEVVADGGLIGGLLLISFLVLLGFSLVKMWNIRRHPQVKLVGIGILTALFAAAFHSLFEFALRVPFNVLIFAMIIMAGIKLFTYKKDFG